MKTKRTLTFDEVHTVLKGESYSKDALRDICRNEAANVNWKIAAAYELFHTHRMTYTDHPEVRQYLSVEDRKKTKVATVVRVNKEG